MTANRRDNIIVGLDIGTTKISCIIADQADLPKAMDELGLPLVVKIPDGSFSRGIHKVSSADEFKRLMQHAEAHTRGIIAIAYYTGMRRGEILSLERHKIDLSRRIITLSPEETKEGHWKRVPIHKNLVHIVDITKVQVQIFIPHIF